MKTLGRLCLEKIVAQGGGGSDDDGLQKPRKSVLCERGWAHSEGLPR